MTDEMEENEIIPLSADDKFTFSCSPDVPCFNECCGDLTQFLTPYDVLRLKNALGMRSGEFLSRYTTQHVGPETGLPVAALKQEPSDGFKCPLVTPEGCSVYEDRPASCRTYPLARLASRSRETGKITEQYVLICEKHCKGFAGNREQTVREWIENQGAEIYNRMNDLFMQIIALKNQRHPEPLDMKERHIFHLGCYDLDAFRDQVFENGLLKDLNIGPETLEAARTDDAVLLQLGMAWVAHALFSAA